ncbi:hypothetical protein C8F04DRAFT_1152155 [Mycena alexandri]|uniref:Secreted protein n=1 Tax=Mycena alexandri TaxID=1745969 RepID=A0AAD6RZH3_9AGAR|nr:hypothetical protein C8F04DRAFT_1152155 [Mycena alexandri]
MAIPGPCNLLAIVILGYRNVTAAVGGCETRVTVDQARASEWYKSETCRGGNVPRSLCVRMSMAGGLETKREKPAEMMMLGVP